MFKNSSFILCYSVSYGSSKDKCYQVESMTYYNTTILELWMVLMLNSN